tara:strand:- start:1427 stop:2896 length:1470 start_codon:yes stop_codon:yes gene_type:complete
MVSEEETGVDEDYLESRSKLVTREEKGGSDWGGGMAQKIWDGLYSRHSPVIDGATILDIGCSWGYLLKFIEETFKPTKMIGTDIRPWWEIEDHGWNYEELGDRIQLIASDLTEIEDIPSESVDLAMCTSVLQYLTPENVEANMEKAYSLLKPGGEMILRTRVWTSAIGADLHREIELPYAHLLYSKAETDRVVEEMGKQTKYLNWLDSNTYLAIFHRVGFEMIDVRRRMNHHAENVASRVLDMYPWVDPKEALCAELEVRMVKPIEEEDEVGADGEVEYRCITCGTSASQFEALNGIEGRRCPQCGSIERTRALIGWLSSNVDFAGKRIFAVAPSDSANKYISAENPDSFDRCDIRPLSGFEIQADISKMPEVESGSYDFAMAIKVLEHCDDDVNAISEICRILEPRGKFIVMGDIRKGVETENIDDPTSFYGNDAFEEYNIGTFRRYGLEDLKDMLDQFFKVKTYEVEDPPTGYKGFLIECSKDSDRN